MAKMIPIKNLKNEFQPGEKDRRFMELYVLALKEVIEARIAFINLDLIEPFTDLLPAVNEGTIEYVTEEEPPLHVYFKDGKFIMSDDYQAYAVYSMLSRDPIPCIILGKFDTSLVRAYSEPISMEIKK